MSWELLQGDSAKLLKTISTETIDLTVTSPPYDNLRDYKGYDFDFETIAKELYRVTKLGGVVVWVVGDATINGSETGTSFKQALYFKEIGFNLHDTMIYAKDSCPYPDTTRYYASFEYMFVLTKGRIKTANLIQDKPNKQAGKKITGTERRADGHLQTMSAVSNNTNRVVRDFSVRRNIWEYQVGKWKVTKDPEAYQHPAIFPEQLAYDHIISWSNSCDLILDPFAGAGTTLKMATLLGRDSIGIEISPEYCELIKKRMANRQQTLFEKGVSL